MKKAYLSSTFQDLIEFRDRAARALRRLQFDVIAMEDYVATDQRPVDRCLTDVGGVDLYVGLIAFRYGYVPKTDNPDGLSVTEMEYRHAVKKGIPRLIFMIPPGRWDMNLTDAYTGDNDNGARIRQFREDLSDDRMMLKASTPDALEAAVTASATQWLGAQEIAAGTTTVVAAAHPRQLASDLVVLHAPSDDAAAQALEEALSAVWTVTCATDVLASPTPDTLAEFDRVAASARAAAVLLSPAAANHRLEGGAAVATALRLARDRTGELLGIATAPVSDDERDAWGLTEVVESSADDTTPNEAVHAARAKAVHAALAQRLHDRKTPQIGLPLVVVTMTAEQTAALLDDPPEAARELIPDELLRLGGSREAWLQRYGATWRDWRPFGGAGETIRQVLEDAVDAVNSSSAGVRGRAIRLQPYPLEALDDDSLNLFRVYEAVAREGCLVVVDELALFHATVRQRLKQSPLPFGEQGWFLTLSPVDPSAARPLSVLRDHLGQHLSRADQRFASAMDPLYEIGITGRHRLVRWLHASLPRTLHALREARQDPEKLRAFSETLGRAPSADMGRLIGGEGERP